MNMNHLKGISAEIKVTEVGSQCFLGSLGAKGKDLTKSSNWRLLIWVQPGQEPVPSIGAHNCGDCPPGSGWEDRRVQPAAKAPEEQVEEWKAWRVERHDETSLDDCSEGNLLFEACSQGCGRRCSALGCPLWGKGPLPVGFGNVVGSNPTVGPCEREAGGGSLERRASLGWAD